MLHYVVIFLLAYALGTSFQLPEADATAVSPADLYVYRFCSGCAPLNDDGLSMPRNPQPGMATTTTASEGCEDGGALDCRPWRDGPGWDEEEAPALSYFPDVKLTNDELATEAFDLRIPVRDQDDYQRTVGCTDLARELHDPKRGEDECSNVQPAPDYAELISVLTLATVSVLSFAVIALAWLGHRFYRNWRLRSMLPQGNSTSNAPVRKRRRRAGGSAVG